MKKITLFVFSLCWAVSSIGQDVHLSQFYNAPLALNPAMTGLMNHDIRLIANYRNQWASISKPYQTFAASIDASILEGAMDDDFFGVGLQLIADKAGDSDLRTTQAQFSTSYSKSLTGSANNYVTFGAQVGYVSRSLSYTNLTFDSQYDGDILNPAIGSGEDFDRFKYGYVDFSAGLAWYVAPSDYSSIYTGVAVAHLNEPNQRFFMDGTEKLYRKLTAHFGAEIAGNESLAFIPSAVVLIQGPHSEVNIGASLRFNLTPDLMMDEGAKALTLGTMYRVKDAQVFLARFDYGPVGVTMSYDVNLSTLRAASKTRGGPEFSIVYRSTFFQGDKRDKRGGIRCPTL